jgi:hypothetical protein
MKSCRWSLPVWLIAELVAADDRFLMLRLPRKRESLRIARDLVTRLETSKGGSRGRGALIGSSVLARNGDRWVAPAFR